MWTTLCDGDDGRVTPQKNLSEPLSDDSVLAVVRLSLIDGVGPLTSRALLERFGSIEAILSAAPSALKEVPRVGVKIARAIAGSDPREAEEVIEDCRENGVTIITERSAAYPRLLREIPDPPILLYCRGQLLPQDNVSLAVVGTRHASHYGRVQAERLARSLSGAGLTIVSGLARGIDGIAHEAALAAGGRTIAVTGGGVLNIYPPEHGGMAQRITESGVVMSESSPRSPPMSGAFPQRNRIITGMSLGVLVVEAALRSGALISARHAMEQGREVFALPGRVDSRTSRGCHRLLRDGACLVESAEDIIEELGPLVEAVPMEDGRKLVHPAELQLNDQERLVLDAIPVEPTSIDDIALACGLPVHRVLATMSVLEMRLLIGRVSGNLVVRK